MAEYIDRSAAVSALIFVENRYNRNRDHENVSAEALYKDLCDAEIEIGKAPAADVAPVIHGRWKPSNTPYERFRCSECGGGCWYYDYRGDVAKSRYCPNCGAKMDLN